MEVFMGVCKANSFFTIPQLHILHILQEHTSQYHIWLVHKKQFAQLVLFFILSEEITQTR